MATSATGPLRHPAVLPFLHQGGDPVAGYEQPQRPYIECKQYCVSPGQGKLPRLSSQSADTPDCNKRHRQGRMIGGTEYGQVSGRCMSPRCVGAAHDRLTVRQQGVRGCGSGYVGASAW